MPREITANASNAAAIKWSEFGLQLLLTAIPIALAAGLVVLLSVKFGLPAVDFDALTF